MEPRRGGCSFIARGTEVIFWDILIIVPSAVSCPDHDCHVRQYVNKQQKLVLAKTMGSEKEEHGGKGHSKSGLFIKGNGRGSNLSQQLFHPGIVVFFCFFFFVRPMFAIKHVASPSLLFVLLLSLDKQQLQLSSHI